MIRPACLVAAAVVLGATGASAQIADVVCAARSQMSQRLAVEYGTALAARGLRSPDVMIEVWTSDRTGAWALVQTYTNGQACIVAMGGDWETFALPGDPA